MKDTARTTIVLPRELLRRAKIHGARTERSLSQLIAEALERSLPEPGQERLPPLPIGKYSLGIHQFPSRQEIYEKALRSKLPS